MAQRSVLQILSCVDLLCVLACRVVPASQVYRSRPTLPSCSRHAPANSSCSQHAPAYSSCRATRTSLHAVDIHHPYYPCSWDVLSPLHTVNGVCIYALLHYTYMHTVYSVRHILTDSSTVLKFRVHCSVHTPRYTR